jgi:hypothetical protein
MPVVVYIPSSVLFPGEPTGFEAFVAAVTNLSRTDTLFWCARINHFLSHPGELTLNERQSHVALRFLSQEQQGLATAWARREGHQREHVALFFRAQLLQLALWVALLAEDRENDGVTFTEPEVRRNFAKAAMISGELWNDAVFRPRNFEETNLAKMKRRAMPAMREGIAAIRKRDPLHVSLARGNVFYGSAFRAHYPHAELDMQRATGLSIREYLSCAAMLTYYNQSDWEEPTLDKPPVYNVTERRGLQTEASSAFDKYLRCASQTPDELSRQMRGITPDPRLSKGVLSELCLREKPFLVTTDGRTIALDAQFAYDKLTLGPLFELCRIRGQCAFPAFGYAVENYVQGLVRATTPDAPSLAARVTCNPKSCAHGTQREFADVLWQLEGTSFCIVEIKASFVPDVALRAEDPETYINAFRKKFSSPSTESSRAQGTIQLAQTIRSIGAHEIQLEGCAGLEPTIYCGSRPIVNAQIGGW